MDRYGNPTMEGVWPLMLIVFVIFGFYIVGKEGFAAIKDKDWAKCSGLSLITFLCLILIGNIVGFNEWVKWAFKMLFSISAVFSSYHLLKGKMKTLNE